MDKLREIKRILNEIHSMLQEIKEDTEYLKGFMKDYQITEIPERKEQVKEEAAQIQEKQGDDKISAYYDPGERTGKISYQSQRL